MRRAGRGARGARVGDGVVTVHVGRERRAGAGGEREPGGSREAHHPARGPAETLTNVQLENVQMKNAQLENVQLENVQLKNLQNVQMKTVQMKNVEMKNV